MDPSKKSKSKKEKIPPSEENLPRARVGSPVNLDLTYSINTSTGDTSKILPENAFPKKKPSLLQHFSRRISRQSSCNDVEPPPPLFVAPATAQLTSKELIEIDDAHTKQIAGQFKTFFGKKERKSSVLNGISNPPNQSVEVSYFNPADETIDESSGAWTAPDSWAVVSDDNMDAPKKTISAKLLEATNATSGDVTTLSNTTLISSITITTSLQEEGIRPATAGESSAKLPLPDVSEPSSSFDDIISTLWSIRVVKPEKNLANIPSIGNEMFVTVACPLDTTAADLCKALAKKFLVQDSSKYQLFVVHRNAERMLQGDDKPILLQKRWLEEAGYTELDGIHKLGREDNRFVCRFLYSELPSSFTVPSNIQDALNSHSVSIRISETEAILPGQNLYLIPVILFRYGATLQTLDISKNLMLNLPLDFVQSCSSLTTIKASDNEYDHIPVAICNAITLRTLDLSSNFLRSDSLPALGVLAHLSKLDLQANQISELPPEFQNLKLLTHLNLSSNNIKIFPIVLLELHMLSNLNLSFNSLERLPDKIDVLSSLIELNLACNALNELPVSINNLRKLVQLDIRGNSITDLGILSGIRGLKRLIADHNRISSLPNVTLPDIIDLSISKNALCQIELSHMCKHLRVLCLSGSKLVILPPLLFESCPSIQKLILDDNQLKTLPESFDLLSESLITLSAVNNKLIAVPSSVGKFSRLDYLDLRGNNLKSLPLDIWKCNNLDVLNVSSNLLTTFPMPPDLLLSKIRKTLKTVGWDLEDETEALVIPHPTVPIDRRTSIDICINSNISKPSKSKYSTLSGMSHLEFMNEDGRLGLASCLRELYIGENRLQDECLDALQYMLHVQILNLSYNDLVEIGSSLKRCSKLRELYLSGNQLTSLPDDMETMTNLKILFVNGNKLTTLPAELAEHRHLTSLDASDNNLKYNIANFQYDWNWNKNSNLVYLNFSGNRKLEISPEAAGGDLTACSFGALSKLRLLDVSQVKISLEHSVDGKDSQILQTPNIAHKRIRCIRVDDSSTFPAISSHHGNSLVDGKLVVYVPSPAAFGVAECLSRLTGELYVWEFLDIGFQGKGSDVLAGIFDGHQSNMISKYLHDYFKLIYSSELGKLERASIVSGQDIRQNRQTSKNSAAVGMNGAELNMPDVMRRTFLNLNRDLGRLVQNGQINDTSGAAAIAAHVYGNRMIVANVGDCSAVLCRAGHALNISTKHSPWNRSERSRIKKRGGFVDTNGLLDGKVHLSRAFGYFDLIPSITAEPSCFVVELTDSDEFVILANAGLWNWIDPQTAIDIIRSRRDDLGAASRRLRDVALSYGAVDAICLQILSLNVIDRENDDAAVSLLSKKRRKEETISGVTDSSLARLEQEIAAPMGQVALVFTDIRNSTLLWEMMPASMEAGIKVHHSIMRRLLRTIGGYEVKTEGDAFMAAFPNVEKGLRWCLHGQLQLLEADWPQEILASSEGASVYDPTTKQLLSRGLSIRMGIHYGIPICELDPITRRMDYFGSMVNKTGRISGMAKGGQITCSSDVYEVFLTFEEQIRTALLDPVFFELGEWKLKGLEIPELLYAVYPKAISGRFFDTSYLTEGILQPTVLRDLKDEDEQAYLPENASKLQPSGSNVLDSGHGEITGAKEFQIKDLQYTCMKTEALAYHYGKDLFDLSAITSLDSNMEQLQLENSSNSSSQSIMDRIESASAVLYLTRMGQASDVMTDLFSSFSSRNPLQILNALERYKSLPSSAVSDEQLTAATRRVSTGGSSNPFKASVHSSVKRKDSLTGLSSTPSNQRGSVTPPHPNKSNNANSGLKI